MRPRRPILIATAFVVLALTGCGVRPAATQTSQPTTTLPPEPQHALVFDMGHGEIFSADDSTQLGQSKAVEQMRNAGFDVRINRDAITAEDLAGVSGLVVAGPMRPLQKEEYVAINDFVKRGGTVLLTIHVPFPVMAVPAHWGLPVQPAIVGSLSPVDASDPGIFLADDIQPGKLTQGVDDIGVMSSWVVTTADKNSEIIVASGANGWIDVDKSGSAESSETGSFGLIGVTTLGRGHVIVSGDDAVFANVAIVNPGNAKLLDNILAFMKKQLDA